MGIGELVASGAGGMLETHIQHKWQHGAFSGERHKCILAFTGQELAAGEAFAATVETRGFELHGKHVADVAVISVERQAYPPLLRIAFELLLLDTCQ
jgi:hypothetical protein